MTDLVFFNTPARKKEVFAPIDPHEVRMYSCGPTVYQYAHIGNFRSFLLSDIARRTLEYNGYKVKQVINITDVGHLVGDENEGDDKVEREAAQQGKTAQEIAQFYSDAFFHDIERMNIRTEGTLFPKATDHIQEQIDLIKTLEEKGFTYTTSDGVYFDTAKFPRYAEFAHLNLAGMQEGARVEANTEKHNPSDFALWKFSPKDAARQQEWESPWGTGFPGWHLECSAMSMKYLGEEFDIHTGGVDHISVHHTNEVAQSECATDKSFARYWLHNEFILVDGKKMSKSLGNILTFDGLVEKNIDPLAYRYWLLGGQYRSQMNFTEDAVRGAQTALERLRKQYAELEDGGSVNTQYKERFTTYINDDLDTPGALALAWELLKDDGVSPADKKATLLDFDTVLGIEIDKVPEEIDIPADVQALIDEREQARTQKDWSRADELRDQIHQKGFEIEDLPQGPKVTRK